MRLNEIKAELYDVIVANPRYGSHKEGRGLPYDEAHRLLIDTFEDYKTPMFREEPRNIAWERAGNDAIKLTNKRNGLVIFFYLRDASNRR